jgi:Kef-type K+ transport system membrane component KefB
MNAFVLLMALLGLSYLSGLISRGRTLPGLGLPSGSEWVVLGFLLGPGLLGVIDRAVQADVEPIVYVFIGWVALVIGLDYCVVRSRRLRPARIVLGVLSGLVTVAAVAGAAWWLAPFLGLQLAPADRWALALGLGAVASETTSNAVRWVAERHGAAAGPLSELLDDLAEAKDVAPIVAAGVGLCLHPRVEVAHRLPWPALTVPAAVLIVGALLGLVAAIMLSRETRTEQSWGIVVGLALLAVGTAARLGLPVVAALFALGAVVGLVSRHRQRIYGMVEPTKRGALLPALLLAGARIEPRAVAAHAAMAAAVLATRALVLFLLGLALAPRSRQGRAGAAPWRMGPAMLPAGELTMTIGLSFALTFAGALGETVLITAAAVTLFGELVGPLALRAALRDAGELQPQQPTTQPPQKEEAAT